MDTKAKILDIAMNLNRIGNWAADDFDGKKNRIQLFLDQTTRYIQSVHSSSLTKNFNKTFNRFKKVYQRLEQTGKKGPSDRLAWAEKMMTWGNILTHRARLIDK